MDLVSGITEGFEGVAKGRVEDLRNLLNRTRKSDAQLGSIRTELEGLRDSWDTLKFDLRERDGLLPLASRLQTIRTLASAHQSFALDEAQPRGKRFVNSTFWATVTGDTIHLLDYKNARLVVGETYQLGIRIGPMDAGSRTIGAAALVEEIFKWKEGQKGVWLEVGVTGLDFTVLGDPVQGLWLPRDAATEPVYFAVVPRVAGTPRLRFCVYLGQQVLQSLRVAALTTEPAATKQTVRTLTDLLAPGTGFPPEVADELWHRTEREVRAEHEAIVRTEAYLRAEVAGFPAGRADDFWYEAERAVWLAGALDVTPAAVGNACYLARLEYSLPAAVEDMLTPRPARALSIVANDHNGSPMITFKAPDVYAVRTDANLPDYVTDVRNALEGVSVVPDPPDRPELWNYAFGEDGVLNTGSGS